MKRILAATVLLALPCNILAQSLPTDGAPAAATGEPLDAQPPAVVDAKEARKAAAAAAKRKRELVRLYGLGPYPDDIEAYTAQKPEALKPLYRNLFVGGERNAVLNFNRLGLAAIGTGNFTEAEWAFDQALGRIEAIYANNPQADAARSVFHNEANKDFKGEPYERSMTYYYRGLLYLRAGDYDNARAAFKGAEFQDTLSESETFQSDFAVMNYLIGWTQQCQGQASSAKESFDIAAKAQPGLTAPDAGDNVLFVAELGNGPIKSRSGSNQEMIVFTSGGTYPENAVSFSLAPAGQAPIERKGQIASSVYSQATTRGGRAIDGIMKGKAQTKEITGGLGAALMYSGASNHNSGGAAAMGLGLALSLFSAAMKTKADVRSWDGLPDLIAVGTARADGADWSYNVEYRTGDAPLPLSGPTMRGSAKGCSVVWTRSKAPVLPAAIVGEDDGVAKAVMKKKPVQEKDRLFRQSLIG